MQEVNSCKLGNPPKKWRKSPARWCPSSLAKLVYNSHVTMVYGTYNYSIHGNKLITGGHHPLPPLFFPYKWRLILWDTYPRIPRTSPGWQKRWQLMGKSSVTIAGPFSIASHVIDCSATKKQIKQSAEARSSAIRIGSAIRIAGGFLKCEYIPRNHPSH